MIIAQEKRKSNIAEFILYMWQVEDLIRSSGFDIDRLEEIVIRKFHAADIWQIKNASCIFPGRNRNLIHVT